MPLYLFNPLEMSVIVCLLNTFLDSNAVDTFLYPWPLWTWNGCNFQAGSLVLSLQYMPLKLPLKSPVCLCINSNNNDNDNNQPVLTSLLFFTARLIQTWFCPQLFIRDSKQCEAILGQQELFLSKEEVGVSVNIIFNIYYVSFGLQGTPVHSMSQTCHIIIILN